mgnify:CR=1 FL=1
MDVYFYFVEGKPYFNITNKCSNNCNFCIRNDRKTMEGQVLWLKNQTPDADSVIAQIPSDINFCQEFTFCGFGEPTYNLTAYLKVAKYLKERKGKVRLNTNGQSDLINKRPTAKDICAVTDTVSISLNESTAKDYQQLCNSVFGENAFEAVIKFAAECKKYGAQVIMSIVDVIGEQKIKQCQKICDEIGVKLRVRKYIPLTQY